MKVSIAAVGAANRRGTKPIDVYFRRTASGWQLVGLDRLPGLDTQPASKLTASCETTGCAIALFVFSVPQLPPKEGKIESLKDSKANFAAFTTYQLGEGV